MSFDYYQPCDECDTRGTWPKCRDCQREICDKCMVPGSVKTEEWDRSDEDGNVAMYRETVLCKACLDAEEAVA